ncbi:winged helix-turn-helix transcriptional regulator [Paenibacillus alkalitolerans]|uniref:winged helix-turn-helix transcriptional regulator n=1 Tax=Paenibacillus alkalitolerans TaxID=2799335 RepID=UPI0018F3EA6D|nr:winged helix-turn-helix transcriptional regulator [Paenibacillus alkalitolerans]
MKTYYTQLEKTLQVIGGKWKSRVLYHIITGPQRTGELKRLVPDITQKMLVQTLRELENDGLIMRKVFNQVPPKVEYSLTELGHSLEPVLEALCHWGGDYMEKTSSKSEVQNLGTE